MQADSPKFLSLLALRALRVHNGGMVTTPYGLVLSRNARAARTRKGLGQEEVAARMRALGYDSWLRQTVSNTEQGKRRPLAEEIAALAAALETSISQLVTPAAEDNDEIKVQAGDDTVAVTVWRWISAINDRTIRWEDGRPVLAPDWADYDHGVRRLRRDDEPG